MVSEYRDTCRKCRRRGDRRAAGVHAAGQEPACRGRADARSLIPNTGATCACAAGGTYPSAKGAGRAASPHADRQLRDRRRGTVWSGSGNLVRIESLMPSGRSLASDVVVIRLLQDPHGAGRPRIAMQYRTFAPLLATGAITLEADRTVDTELPPEARPRSEHSRTMTPRPDDGRKPAVSGEPRSAKLQAVFEPTKGSGTSITSEVADTDTTGRVPEVCPTAPAVSLTLEGDEAMSATAHRPVDEKEPHDAE